MSRRQQGSCASVRNTTLPPNFGALGQVSARMPKKPKPCKAERRSLSKKYVNMWDWYLTFHSFIFISHKVSRFDYRPLVSIIIADPFCGIIYECDSAFAFSFFCVQRFIFAKMGCAGQFFLSVKKRTAACCKHATVLWVSRMVRHHDHLGGLCPHRSVPMPILRRPTWQRQFRTGLFSSGLVRTVLLSGFCSRSNRREGSPLRARQLP